MKPTEPNAPTGTAIKAAIRRKPGLELGFTTSCER
jgi:hypothetical protein